MFERFTDNARKTMALANRSAMAWKSTHIEPEHMLLGILGLPACRGYEVLKNLKVVDLSKLQRLIELQLKPQTDPDPSIGKLPISEKTKQTIIRAIDGDRELLHQNYIGTEHLLLAIVGGKDDLAAKALQGVGVELKTAVAEVRRIYAPAPETNKTS